MIVLARGVLTWGWTKDGRPKNCLNLKRFFKSLGLVLLAALCIYGVKTWLHKADQAGWAAIDRVYAQKDPLVGQD